MIWLKLFLQVFPQPTEGLKSGAFSCLILALRAGTADMANQTTCCVDTNRTDIADASQTIRWDAVVIPVVLETIMTFIMPVARQFW